MDFNQAVEIALRTWYPKNHPLHYNPHHPLGKLLGEWGELLDDYMKSLYKPGYEFEPEDELGDIWYYIRVLCYQKDITPKVIRFPHINTDRMITIAMLLVAWLFLFKWPYRIILNFCYTTLTRTSDVNSLTRSNWEKLKPGSERGEQWREARELYHSKS